MWRARDGSAPESALTPKAAQDALDDLLEAERKKQLRRPERAVDLGWLADSPAMKLEIITQPPAEPDFNVLEPSQVEAVARAVADVPADEVPHYWRSEGATSTSPTRRCTSAATRPPPRRPVRSSRRRSRSRAGRCR